MEVLVALASLASAANEVLLLEVDTGNSYHSSQSPPHLAQLVALAY